MKHESDELHATATYISVPVSAQPSQVQIGLSGGASRRFADETAELLCRRLKAASLILSVILAIALVGTLLLDQPSFLALRLAVLLTIVSAYVLLRVSVSMSLPALRAIELVVFGGLVVQISALLWSSLSRYAQANDFATLIGAENVYLADFSVLILVYGMLMPNSWQRAAAVLLPVACVPYAIIYLSQWFSLEVNRALQADHFGLALPLPLVAAGAAIYGTSVVNLVRREAFNARQFGQYRLKDKIGTGGMGDVYRAEHSLLKRPCAIKLINPRHDSDAAALRRFETEVQATARLTHWNSVEIFDFGHTADGKFYYVMEYLEGKSCEELVRDHGPLPAARAIHLMGQVCGALKEAHGLGLVHRDLKPANIFAAAMGGVHDVAKLLDFGLVRQTGAAQAAAASSEGRFGGSPLYMPPEQATDFDAVDARGDIYALGAVLYFLVTGRPPFTGDNPVAVLLAHASEPVVPPSRIVSATPADLEQVILRCLEKHPSDRYQDIASLEAALADCESAGRWTESEASAWWRQVRA